jgi:glycosyltransferase involved in cell wall biosynthesis
MIDYYKGLFKVAKKFERPDVIIASSVHPLTMVAGIKIAKRFNIPCICEVRDLWPESFVAYGIIKRKNQILKLLYIGEKWIYKNADKLIFTMEGGKDYIIEKGWDKMHGGPIDLKKVYNINNAVDLEVFKYNKENYILEDKDLTDKKKFKVIYTGSIRLVNKIEKILEVAKLLKDKDVKFLVWGDGDQLENLKRRVKDEEIYNVYFKGGVDKKYIPYIISNANLNIVFGENMPIFRFGISMNKMFDYFASGRPTLFTFKVGYSLVNKYNAGIELYDSSAENIARNILDFMDLDRLTYDKYCENASRLAEDYSFKNLTNSLIDIIEKND